MGYQEYKKKFNHINGSIQQTDYKFLLRQHKQIKILYNFSYEVKKHSWIYQGNLGDTKNKIKFIFKKKETKSFFKIIKRNYAFYYRFNFFWGFHDNKWIQKTLYFMMFGLKIINSLTRWVTELLILF